MSKHQSVSGEIRAEQKKALKDMTFKGKLMYFWDYYKIHTLVFIILIFAVTGIIRDIANSKDYIFYATMMNAYDLNGEAVSADFAAYADLDTEQYNCYVDTSSTFRLDSFSEYDMATSQMIMAVVQTGDMDVMVTGADVFTDYAENELFLDLTTLYTEEELTPYQDYFYYVDLAVILAEREQNTVVMDAPELTADDWAAIIESHRHPENMKTPVLVGIFVDDSAFVKATGSYPQGPTVFGIVANTSKPENAKAYLEYLWNTSGPATDTAAGME